MASSGKVGHGGGEGDARGYDTAPLMTQAELNGLSRHMRASVEALRKWAALTRKRDIYGEHLKMGGRERISSYIQYAQINFDPHQPLTMENYERITKVVDKGTEAALGYLTTCGVVGALLITLMYPLALSPFTVSDESAKFFLQRTIEAFQYIYFAFITSTLVLAMLVVYFSVRMYMEVNMMSSMRSRLWYLDSSRLVMVALMCLWCFRTLVAALPFGAAIYVTPIAGIILGVLAGVFIVAAEAFEGHANRTTIGQLHQDARNITGVGDQREVALY